MDERDEQPKGRIGYGKAAAIYARAPEPSEPQRTPVEVQVEACRALADVLGYAVPDEATFTDTGAGHTLARPGLSALIGHLAAGGAGALIVYGVDRIAKRETTPLELLLRELGRREIPLYIANVPRGYRYDPTTGRLLDDPDEVDAANREEWRPPEFYPVPRLDAITF